MNWFQKTMANRKASLTLTILGTLLILVPVLYLVTWLHMKGYEGWVNFVQVVSFPGGLIWGFYISRYARKCRELAAKQSK